MFEIQKRKVSNNVYLLAKTKNFEYERFCDFLGKMVTKYIHEINFDEVNLNDEIKEPMPFNSIYNEKEVSEVSHKFENIKHLLKEELK